MDTRTPPRSAAELLQRYARGERSFAEAELDDPSCDFREAVLEDANLSRACIVADFRGANLRRANFTQANVKTCDFRGADLQGAVLRGAALCSTSFGGANLTDADFAGAYYHSYKLASGEKPDW